MGRSINFLRRNKGVEPLKKGSCSILASALRLPAYSVSPKSKRMCKESGSTKPQHTQAPGLWLPGADDRAGRRPVFYHLSGFRPNELISSTKKSSCKWTWCGIKNSWRFHINKAGPRLSAWIWPRFALFTCRKNTKLHQKAFEFRKIKY